MSISATEPKPKRTPIINPATGKPDEAAIPTQEIPSVIVSADLTGETPVASVPEAAVDDEKTASGAPEPPPSAAAPEPPPGPDPYAVLGLKRGVPLDEAKKAYRALILQYHPDKVASLAPEFKELAEKRTRELNEAFATIEKELS